MRYQLFVIGDRVLREGRFVGNILRPISWKTNQEFIMKTWNKMTCFVFGRNRRQKGQTCLQDVRKIAPATSFILTSRNIPSLLLVSITSALAIFLLHFWSQSPQLSQYSFFTFGLNHLSSRNIPSLLLVSITSALVTFLLYFWSQSPQLSQYSFFTFGLNHLSSRNIPSLLLVSITSALAIFLLYFWSQSPQLSQYSFFTFGLNHLSSPEDGASRHTKDKVDLMRYDPTNIIYTFRRYANPQPKLCPSNALPTELADAQPIRRDT
ncbi:hypothetical protein RRG08_028051 [Elysia crispata]|uniref:Uncharacterized protein n=1 Tax=Elysia crispata TaxID=231223 RepID=A0AAE1A787_9GAST|nr:hypothetical protein RRG08_028051 [Elysia crispata]